MPKDDANTDKQPLKVNPMAVHVLSHDDGLKLQIETAGADEPFTYPHPFTIPEHDRTEPPQGHVEDAKTLAELQMIKLSWAIRSKNDWQNKLKQPEILNRWKEEAAFQQEQLSVETKLTANMINYVFTELEAYARLSDPNTGIQHACNDVTFCSYSLIPDAMSRDLQAGVAGLEDVPDDAKDWHPGSDGQVLDLVHPSLYCLVYDQTLARFDDGDLAEISPPQNDDYDESEDPFTSQRFAWLPSDFSVGDDGEVYLVSPYINNLHKSNDSLYSVIPKILGCFVPMFERVLGAIDRTDRPRTHGSFLYYGVHDLPEADRQSIMREYTPLSGRIQHDESPGDVPCIWANSPDGRPYDQAANDSGYPGYLGDTEDEKHSAWLRSQPMTLPESHAQYQGALEAAFRKADLRGRTLQCIVKLANIHLTAEKPSYPGGSWHVEGMLNERIVATGIYYYDTENISESQLEFRTSLAEPPYHEQYDGLCMQILYGLNRDHALVQERGSITTSAGLALAFPNVYQHRVSPFHLSDASKPGHRKILAFFLVDPNVGIPSATDIAPQQEEWMYDFMQNLGADGIGGTRLVKLPVELRRMVVERTEGLMSRKEANAIREELMEERSNFVQVYDEEVMQLTFNMCEH